MYSADLAHVHDTGYGAFSKRVAPEVARLLRQSGLRGGRIVEIGCGAGTVARHLTDRGYDVLGIDVSPAMIRIARARAPRARFRVASWTTVRLPRCDAIVSVGEVLTYVPKPAALRALCARAFDALAPGGLLLFDFVASARGRTFAPRTISGADWTMIVQAKYEHDSKILTRQMGIVRTSGGRIATSAETHRVRVYGARELRRMLERAGFSVRVRRTIGRYRLMTGDLAVVARKGSRV